MRPKFPPFPDCYFPFGTVVWTALIAWYLFRYIFRAKPDCMFLVHRSWRFHSWANEYIFSQHQLTRIPKEEKVYDNIYFMTGEPFAIWKVKLKKNANLRISKRLAGQK